MANYRLQWIADKYCSHLAGCYADFKSKMISRQQGGGSPARMTFRLFAGQVSGVNENILGLFKNVQMQGARVSRNETYFVYTSQ
jgi:hypothetical protein